VLNARGFGLPALSGRTPGLCVTPLATLGRIMALSARFSLIVLAASVGCRTVVPVAAPREFVSLKQPHIVWLTESRDSVMRMTNPRLSGDTIIGLVNGKTTAVPLSQVTNVRAARISTAKTIALAAAGATAVAAVVWYRYFRDSGVDTRCVLDYETGEYLC